MTAELVGIDSRVFGRNVLSIKDFDPAADFVEFERSYISRFTPFYASCKIPIERVAEVHRLEDAGFRLIECQIRSSVKLRRPFDVSACNYDFEAVTREEELREVLEIAGATFTHDRFSIDAALEPAVSGARYRAYICHSFHSPDEAVYRLIDRSTRETVAFKTHRYVSNDEVLFLLGGVHPEMKRLGIGPINEYFEFNELIRKGIRRGTTHISASNYPVFNLEIGNLGFHVLTSLAVMRKVYP